MAYKWNNAIEWLLDHIEDAAQQDNVAELASVARELATAADPDTIQDIFQSDGHRLVFRGKPGRGVAMDKELLIKAQHDAGFLYENIREAHRQACKSNRLVEIILREMLVPALVLQQRLADLLAATPED